MRKTLMLTGLATLSLSATAVADKPETTGKPADKPAKADRPTPSAKEKGKGTTKRCKTHRKAFNVHGTLVSQALTANADGTVDGTVVVKTQKRDKATKKVVAKETTYTLDDAKLSVKTDDRNADGKSDLTDVKAGDRVKLEGRVTHQHGRKCLKGDFTPTMTLRRVKFDDPKPAKPEPTPTPAPVS